MIGQILERQFEAIGARLQMEIAIPRSRVPEDFTLDIARDRRGEIYKLVVNAAILDILELQAVDVQPKRRHLLLLAKRLEGDANKRKFLCGHDERHWFVAAVPRAQSVARVVEAMEALKPMAARRSQYRHGVRAREWNRRRNAGFIRQGEWFFLPRPDFTPPESGFMLHHEPIQRSGGKPHIVECLVRFGGETVYVNSAYPRGLTEAEYQALIARNPHAASRNWQAMTRNPTVYARGKVCHPDHATITLPFWHQVVMSEEARDSRVVFLD